MTTTHPRGRRPGGVDTRAEILDAALRLFSAEGYDKVSLRAVAREAGVDPALIHHYFEDKADLFARSVISVPLDLGEPAVDRIVNGPRDEVGRRAAETVMDAVAVPGTAERLAALIRQASTSDDGLHPLTEYLSRELFAKVAKRLGHSDAELRGNLTMMVLVGWLHCRDVLKLPKLVKQRRAQSVTQLTGPLQFYLAESW